MANSFFRELFDLVKDAGAIPPRLGPVIPIPRRPTTAELAEDLLVDPEALKLETHEPGVFDEKGDYIPQYSDDPKDLESITPSSLDAPEGDTEPESPSAENNPSQDSPNPEIES